MGTTMSRLGLTWTLVIGAAAVSATLAWGGVREAWGAAMGLGLVIVFVGINAVVSAPLANLDPTLVRLVVFGLYILKVVLLGGALVVVGSLELLREVADHESLGLTAIICTLACTSAQVTAAMRMRALTRPGRGVPPHPESRWKEARSGPRAREP